MMIWVVLFLRATCKLTCLGLKCSARVYFCLSLYWLWFRLWLESRTGALLQGVTAEPPRQPGSRGSTDSPQSSEGLVRLTQHVQDQGSRREEGSGTVVEGEVRA